MIQAVAVRAQQPTRPEVTVIALSIAMESEITARRAFLCGMGFQARTENGGILPDPFLSLRIVHADGSTREIEYRTETDVPTVDVPCSCGANGCYFLKWEDVCGVLMRREFQVCG